MLCHFNDEIPSPRAVDMPLQAHYSASCSTRFISTGIRVCCLCCISGSYGFATPYRDIVTKPWRPTVTKDDQSVRRLDFRRMNDRASDTFSWDRGFNLTRIDVRLSHRSMTSIGAPIICSAFQVRGLGSLYFKLSKSTEIFRVRVGSPRSYACEIVAPERKRSDQVLTIIEKCVSVWRLSVFWKRETLKEIFLWLIKFTTSPGKYRQAMSTWTFYTVVIFNWIITGS